MYRVPDGPIGLPCSIGILLQFFSLFIYVVFLAISVNFVFINVFYGQVRWYELNGRAKYLNQFLLCFDLASINVLVIGL